MAHHPDEDGREVHPEKSQERRRARRQEHVEDGSREHPVQDRQRELQKRHRRRRQRHRDQPGAQRRLPEDGRRQICGDTGQEQPAARSNRGFADREGRGQRAEYRANATEGEDPDPQRHRIEEHHPRQFLGGDAPTRVEAVTHRRAREPREPEAVGDRIRQSRGQRDPPRREGVRDEAEREQVVADQHGVVRDRQDRCGREAPERRTLDVDGDLVPRRVPQLDSQHLERGGEQHERDDDRQDLLKPTRGHVAVRDGIRGRRSVASESPWRCGEKREAGPVQFEVREAVPGIGPYA